jgi:GAF domain-containing protein
LVSAAVFVALVDGDLVPDPEDFVRQSPSSEQSEDVPPGGKGAGVRGIPGQGHAASGDVAALMSDLARSLQSKGSFEGTLQAITHVAVDTIPGAQMCGITLVRERKRVETRAATDELVSIIDAAQYETGEGPCLTALWEERTIRAPDISTDERWPIWRQRVTDLGIRSMMSFQLFVHDSNLGALNFYAVDINAFDDDDENIGVLFAAHSAVALVGAQEMAGLKAALTHRDIIGQAKGVLMERYNLDADAAFQLLVRASQNTHMKLHEAALKVTQRD